MFFQIKQCLIFAFFVSLLTGMHASVDLDNGLVGYWSFDIQDGSQAVDSSGNAMHGTLVNVDTSTAFVDGKVNQAIHLDGVDDYINIPHHSSLDIRRTISVSMWIKIDSFSQTYHPLFIKGQTGGSNTRTYSLWTRNDNKYYHLTSADSTAQQTSDSAINSTSSNVWYHLVSLIDRTSGTMNLYSNNTQIISNNTLRVSDSFLHQ